MDFRLELNIKTFEKKIHWADKIFLIGSCFTEHISKRLACNKFSIVENPHGILFNPKSIETALKRYADKKVYQATDLFFHNELYGSWEHHGQSSQPSVDKALQGMNDNVKTGNTILKQCNWVIITLGSSWVYETTDLAPLQAGLVAANCHKMPAQYFNHRLLSAAEVSNSLKNMLETISSINPDAQIIFTISPVRHNREGLVENNRSKALLISAVHETLQIFKHSFYFPAYELIIDDLRDYRFFAEDMVHPNYQATQYVWEKFVDACMATEVKKNIQQLARIIAARNHKPLHPQTKQHQQFLQKMLLETKKLQAQFSFIDLKDELKYFEVESNEL